MTNNNTTEHDDTPGTERLGAQVPEAQAFAVRMAALVQKTSVTAIIREALTDWLEKNQERTTPGSRA